MKRMLVQDKKFKDAAGRKTYFAPSTGVWNLRKFDKDGNQISFEDNTGLRIKFDKDGKEISREG
jgi:hypothetical protein